jgi:hypothetical protein
MYNNTQEKVIQLELFNVSDIQVIPTPSKKPHNHDRKFENYLTRFVIRSKKGKK